MRKNQTGVNSENILNTKNTKRQGDWVCMMCNNLNYSFRHTCNRCKNVTRQQNFTLNKTQKDRQPLGELSLNRHSSYKEQIQNTCLNQEDYCYRSHTKKHCYAQPIFAINEFNTFESTQISQYKQVQGFSSLLFLTPNRYNHLKQQQEKDEYSQQDSKSPCVLSAVSPLLRALKDEINCHY